MQSAKDFEKRIYTAQAEIAAILAGERAAEHGATLSTAAYLCGRCQSASASLKGTEPLTRKERAILDAKVKIDEEKELRSWAGKSGLWVDRNAFNRRYAHRFVDEGAEQKVFLKEDSRTVVKLNTGIYHSTWHGFFNRLILHTALFPETNYTLTAFTEEGQGLCAVIEQPWITASRGAAKEEIEAYLLQTGFVNLKYDGYYNKEHGILLADLHDENVFIGLHENIFFIDPVIYLETPDLALGGKAQFHFPF